MSSPKISVVLAHYNRPEALQPQIDAIWNQTIQPHETIIAHVENEATKDYDFEDFQVVRFSQDPGLRFKFIGAMATDPDSRYINILDGDCIPGKKWLENCLHTLDFIHDGVIGGLGCRYTENYYEHISDRNKTHDEFKFADFIGQSWFFERRHLMAYLKHPQPPLNTFSGNDDIWFSDVMHRNNYQTVVPPKPADDKELWHNRVALDMDTGLCNTYDQHKQDRKKIIDYIRGEK